DAFALYFKTSSTTKFQSVSRKSLSVVVCVVSLSALASTTRSLLDANMLSSCSGVPQICCTTATTQGICTSPVPFDSMSGICPTWPFVKQMAMYFLDLVRRQFALTGRLRRTHEH